MENKNLEHFIQKMYDLSFSQKEKNYTEAELKSLAMETGMSESEWEASREEFRRKKQSGMRHNTHGNYSDAVSDLEYARALNPFDNSALLALAQAYQGLGNFDKAEQFAQAAIDAGAEDEAAYRLLRQINQQEAISSKNRKKLLRASIIVVAGLLLIVLMAFISMKNKVTERQELVKEKWAQVENVYQRRADLIPALVKTVKAASEFEKEVLSELTEARSKVGSVQLSGDELSQEQIDAFAARQDELGGAISRLLAVSENYPELQSLQNFRDLQVQIEGSENRISVERRRYNEEVRKYNTYIKKFPRSLFGYEEMGYFKAKTSAQEVPDIDL